MPQMSKVDAFLAGAVSGMVSRTAIAPVERVKILVQVRLNRTCCALLNELAVSRCRMDAASCMRR